MGVLSSWVTALRKLSCCSLRRISRTRKTVLTDTPAMISPKKIMPRTRGTTRRQLMTIQLTFTIIVKATRHTPNVIKKAIDFVRVEMRMEAAAQDIVAKQARKQNL